MAIWTYIKEIPAPFIFLAAMFCIVMAVNLRVAYIWMRERGSFSVRPANDGLKVQFATYGDGDFMHDVTEVVRSRLYKDTLSLDVRNHILGCDPSPHARKNLTVYYSFVGRERVAIVPERGTLELPLPPKTIRQA